MTPKTKTNPVTAFLSRLFNVAPHEFPRISLAWTLKFCFQVGFTIGWTMLTAMLVNRLGIGWLPLLFVTNAGLIILGTVVFSEIIHRFSRKVVIYGTIISGAILLIAAVTALTATDSLRLFFALALLAESVFFAQLNILLGLFIEDLFSPLESERAFPLIESSEYVGGIVGGLTILGALELFHLEAPQLAFIWVGAVAVILPVLVIFYRHSRKLPSLQVSRPKGSKISKLSKIREGGRHIRNTPFLTGLVFVVMLQWTFFTLLNFQYTKAVDENVSHSETTAASSQSAADSTHSSAPTKISRTADGQLHASGESTAHHENLLTHGLGTLHIAFSLLALVTQLFLTSRVLKRFGIVRTLALHPLFSFLASLGLALKFGFISAVSSKALFEATTGIYNAAYHSSFYALRESVREHAKAFLEGLIRPLGVILGTGLLFTFEYFLHGSQLTSAVSITMLIAAGTMGILLWWLRNRYTHISKKNLEMFGDHPAKFNSIEILAQHGHQNSAEILVKNLLYKKESEMLRIKILETLGRIGDPRTIPEIITCFDDPSPQIKLAAVNTLAEFKNLGSHFFTQAFTRYRVISALKELFEKEDSKEIRSAIVHVFANMHQAEIVPFLVQALQTTDTSVRADCIYVCGLFHDISAAHYLEPHLESADPYVKANSVIALWQFPQYRLRLTISLTGLLEADDKPTQKAAIHMLGEIGALQERPRLERYLEHDDSELRLLAALALAKLSHEGMPNILADFVLHADQQLSGLAKKHLRRIPESIQKKIDQIVHHRLSNDLNSILTGADADNLQELPPATLNQLRQLYSAATEWEEVAKIDAALAGRDLD